VPEEKADLDEHLARMVVYFGSFFRHFTNKPCAVPLYGMKMRDRRQLFRQPSHASSILFSGSESASR